MTAWHYWTMPDTEVLGILRITCEVLNSHKGGRKFNSQTKHLTDGIKSKAYTVKDHRVGSGDATKPNNVNSLD